MPDTPISGVITGTFSTTIFIPDPIPGSRGPSFFMYQVENLRAGQDIGNGTAANARSIFVSPDSRTVGRLSVVSQGPAAGVDDANPVTVSVYRVGDLMVAKTYNASAPFPPDHGEDDLGTLANADFAAGQDLRLGVVCGPAAQLPSFVLEVIYA